MAARYQFRLTPPGERLSMMISQRGQETRLVALLRGQRRPLTDRTLVRAALLDPLMSLKVIAAIHVEALRLWLKGARLQPRPDPNDSRDQHVLPISPQLKRSAKHGDHVQAG
jgi:DUF1365 family protein